MGVDEIMSFQGGQVIVFIITVMMIDSSHFPPLGCHSVPSLHNRDNSNASLTLAISTKLLFRDSYRPFCLLHRLLFVLTDYCLLMAVCCE